MKLPLSWLKDYVEWNVTPEELVEKLMWRGFEVASIEEDMAGISGVVVGKIVSLRRHENSDHLLVCSVDVGAGDPLQIVTGAPNVFEGALVPAALDGATLVGGVTINPTVMRGVASAGMLCSGEELGLTETDYPGAGVHGILILQGEHKPGTDIRDALGAGEIVFNIELTPNRADCQSILGMCREVAAALGQKFKEPVIRRVKGEGNAADYASVTVKNSELCPRYCARVVTDLKIEPSPAWMQKRLRAVGMRPINN
ncbi:MAG TPA: phenylalanine--tRNA ligase beta subunit-related protein, partial [Clostridia bacterium]|nr:phenylalanine--tRNA ligase beta subunit-related protein [Clostridia bacterium]